MSQFVGNQERLALEGLNDFFVDLDVVLGEAESQRESSLEKGRKRKRNRPNEAQDDSNLSTLVSSANFEATLFKTSRVTNQIIALRSLADRLEQVEDEISRL